jgi:hypothetical protein
MFFGSLRIVVGVNRDCWTKIVQHPIAINSENYPKRTEEHYRIKITSAEERAIFT